MTILIFCANAVFWYAVGLAAWDTFFDYYDNRHVRWCRRHNR